MTKNNNSDNPEDKENNIDGFKFAITFLAAVGTIVYALYIYFQTSVLDNSFFIPVMGLTNILLILPI